MNCETARILRFLFGKPLNISREIALRLRVQLKARHGAVNVDRASERLCDLMQGHAKATRDGWRRSFLRGTIDDQPSSDYFNKLFRTRLCPRSATGNQAAAEGCR
jgi:hypothetical protein